jgi:ABC-type xylose transport system permease subunit
VYSLAAQAVIASVAVAVMIAMLAAFAAVRARYPRPILIAGSLLLFHGLALVLLSLAEKNGIAAPFLVEAAFAVTGWTLVVAMVLATIYFFWSGLAERAMTIRYASVAFLSSAAFAAVWLTVLYAAGVQFAGMQVSGIVGILWPVLLPLVASAVAPWSLSRVRHI